MVLIVPEQSQRPYRFGMTLLCVGALFNWLGLADSYSDPVPAIRYIGVGLIAAGASLICMAMCFWMRNIRDPNISSDYNISSSPVHVISVDPSPEKPPDYSTVVDVPPCYEDAIKLTPAGLTSLHMVKHVPLINVYTLSQSNGTSNASGKNCTTTMNTEGSDSSQFDQSTDNIDFSTATEKSDETASSITAVHSSQNENPLTKVLRKSIRGIRKLRNGNEDCNQSNENSSNSDNNCSTDRIINIVESTSKTER